MLYSSAKKSAYRAGLAGVCRVDVFNSDSNRLRLVGDKGLQLRPRPPVQAGAHTLPGLDPFANVGQVLHGDCTAFVSYRFRNNGLTDFVVDVGYMASFAPGDFAERLTCALRAVALKPPTKGKEFVAGMPEFTATKELSCTHGGDVVFAEIESGDAAGFSLFYFGKVEYQVEEEFALTVNQFGFLGGSVVEEAFLELSQFHWDNDPSLSGEQGNGVAFDAVGSFVEVDRAGVPEVDHRPGTLLEFRVVGQQGFIGLSNSSNSVAGHLGAEIRGNFSDTVVSKVVKRNTVTARVFNSKRHQHIARTGKLLLQERQSSILFERCAQFYADSAFHSAPSLDVFSSLNVPSDRFGADVTGSTNVVGGRPEVATPQGFLQFRELGKEFPGSRAFQDLYRIGHGISRWKRHKQVEVVGLNLQGDNFPFMFGANIPQHSFKGGWDITRQNRFPVLRTPHHMVCGLVDAIPAINCFNHSHIVISNTRQVNCKCFLPRLKSGVSAQKVDL